MYIIRFGGYSLPAEQYDMNESQGATRRGAGVDLPGGGGSWDLVGLQPDPLAEDTITKSFFITAASATALQTAVDDFIGQMMLSQHDWRAGVRALIGQLPDGSKRVTWAKCVEARWTLETYHYLNSWIGPVNVTWRRRWPVWWDYEDLLPLGDQYTFADTASFTFGQSVILQAVTTSPVTLTITNAGNARMSSGIVEFDGPITNPTLINARNKHSLAWTGSLGAGDRLTVNLDSLEAKKNGQTGQWANITVGTDGGQIMPMVLEPGANVLQIRSTGANCTFRYYFGDGWM